MLDIHGRSAGWLAGRRPWREVGVAAATGGGRGSRDGRWVSAILFEPQTSFLTLLEPRSSKHFLNHETLNHLFFSFHSCMREQSETPLCSCFELHGCLICLGLGDEQVLSQTEFLNLSYTNLFELTHVDEQYLFYSVHTNYKAWSSSSGNYQLTETTEHGERVVPISSKKLQIHRNYKAIAHTYSK